MNSTETPALFETMRLEGGQIAHLDRHLARLTASSKAFSISFNIAKARDALADLSLGVGLHRVRLTLFPDGNLSVEVAPFPSTPFQTTWLCPDPMLEAGGPFCVHKTTRREHYDSRLQEAQALGADEAIVLNHQGEVVEGTRTTIWVQEGHQLWTPPLSSGGLPGVGRAYLLATHPRAGERVLRPDDLARADAIFLSNALRGLMQVELV